MYQYLLFDLDGTLTDSAEGIIKCVQYAAEKMGAAYKSAEELKIFVGPPLSESFKNVYEFSEEETQKAIQYYRERFKPIGMFENAVYPGVPQMLKSMKENRYPIRMKAYSTPSALTFFQSIFPWNLDTSIPFFDVMVPSLYAIIPLSSTWKFSSLYGFIAKFSLKSKK